MSEQQFLTAPDASKMRGLEIAQVNTAFQAENQGVIANPEAFITLGPVVEHIGRQAIIGSTEVESESEKYRRYFSEGFGVGVGVPEGTSPEVPVPVRDKPYVLEADLTAYEDTAPKKLGKHSVLISHGFINPHGEWVLRDGRLIVTMVTNYNRLAADKGIPPITALAICQDSPDAIPPESELLDGLTYIAGSKVIVSGAKNPDGTYEVSLRAQNEQGKLNTPEHEQTNLEMYEAMLSTDERAIFAPYESPYKDTRTADELADETIGGSAIDDKYDNLMSSSYDNTLDKTDKAAVMGDEKTGLKVTEDGERFSTVMLSKIKDSNVLAILKERAKELRVDQNDSREIMKMIREDKETRYALAVSLLRKLDGLVDQPNMIPPRVGRRNERKGVQRHFGTYRTIENTNETMPSRDYVACMGLSFIDGTYEAGKPDFEYLSKGFDPKVGEHRFAAAGLLTNNWERPSGQ